ncbi:MAG: amino acid adenylation domain-containing protein [Clostridia bacterium]|nr:amino acid adenylation domain-containing protein [Clostridia bacterium]
MIKLKNVLQYLEESTIRNSEKIAIIEEEKKCTYAELLSNSKKVGTALSNYINSKEPVAVLMEKGINTIYSFFGSVYAGGFYSLLNPELPNDRLKQILNVTKTKVIVTDEEHFELANELVEDIENLTILKIEELINTEVNEEKLEIVRKKALDVDPLYANFTSGSTGVPKGVLVGHRSVIDFIEIFTNQFKITYNDIIANQAPFDFDVSVKDIYSSIAVGATLLIVPRRFFSKPAELLDYLCENNATTLIWAVSALCLITTFHGLDYKVPEKVNKVLFSGEVMPLKHLKQWVEKLPNTEFVNLYGPTEITCNCTYHIIDKQLNYEKQIPMGQPFDNEEVFLLDENNQLVTDYEKVGEICVRGTALALGYYNNNEQTNKNFVQNPLNTSYLDPIYKTGDLGFLGKDNNYYFCGRKDFQIKHMGHRIELEEIELAINKHKEIQRVCCVYDEEKSKLYAFYIGNIDKRELKEQLTNQLPVFMVPNVIRQIEEMPLTKNGKIDRKALLERN